MIELTQDQAQALAQAGELPTVLDPTTKKTYALVPTEEVGSHGRQSSPSLSRRARRPIGDARAPGSTRSRAWPFRRGLLLLLPARAGRLLPSREPPLE